MITLNRGPLLNESKAANVLTLKTRAVYNYFCLDLWFKMEWWVFICIIPALHTMVICRGSLEKNTVDVARTSLYTVVGKLCSYFSLTESLVEKPCAFFPPDWKATFD